MHILSLLNVTNRERLTTDSGYIFYNLLADKFIESGGSFTFASPSPVSNKNTKHVLMELGRNKYEARFAFDWDKISELVRSEKPDVILINQMELAPNFRALVTSLGVKTKIAGYAHYIPYDIDEEGKIRTDNSLNGNGLWESIKLNFLSGLQSADVVFTHSETAIRFIMALYLSYGIQFPEPKFVIAPPPRDPLLTERVVSPKSGRRVIYNHRLYEHYGTEFFIRLAHQLTTKLSADIHVMDILGERSPERQKLDTSVDRYREELSGIDGVTLRRDGDNRDTYKLSLSGARCVIAPFRTACTWSMSCIDAMGMGVPVMAPDISWFKERVPEDLRFTSVDEALEISDRLFVDDAFWLEKSRQVSEATEDLEPDNIANSMISSLELIGR